MSCAALGVGTHCAIHVERRVSAIEEPNKEFLRKHCHIQALGLRQQRIPPVEKRVLIQEAARSLFLVYPLILCHWIVQPTLKISEYCGEVCGSFAFIQGRLPINMSLQFCFFFLDIGIRQPEIQVYNSSTAETPS